MTRAYVRVRRGDGVVNVEIEHLTTEERAEFLKGAQHRELLRWLDVVCGELAAAEALLGAVARDALFKDEGTQPGESQVKGGE